MMISTYLLLLSAACFLFEGLHSLPQTRIINGQYTEIERAPWQVSIQLRGEHYCGGSVYSDRIIITAAHCFYIPDQIPPRLLDKKEFLIVAGSEFKRSRETLAAVSAKMHHVDFNMLSLSNDIGIMKLLNPLPISKQVKPIPLALKDPAPGSVVLSTGWGMIKGRNSSEELGVMSEVLKAIHISIKSRDYCNISSHGQMGEGQICAGSAVKAICQGDSGGPLVFNNTLVGVVSYTVTLMCDEPGFYVSVAYYRGWIINAIKSILKK